MIDRQGLPRELKKFSDNFAGRRDFKADCSGLKYRLLQLCDFGKVDLLQYRRVTTDVNYCKDCHYWTGMSSLGRSTRSPIINNLMIFI